VSNTFQLKNMTAGELMVPLQEVQMIPSHATVAEMRHLLSIQYSPFIPVFHRSPQNIVSVAYIRDFLRTDDTKRILETARSPWFVTKNTPILKLMQQFRRNNQSLAIILDGTGEALGVLTLDQILEEIFGEEAARPIDMDEPQHYIQRTLSGDMSVAEFKIQFDAEIEEAKGSTLSDLIQAELDHPPVKGESVRMGDFEFTVEEITLRGVKTLTVRSVQE
jgi:putative hemolysin